MGKSNIQSFLDELDLLSRKHGVWIEVDPHEKNSVSLIDENLDTIAYDFHCEEDSQEYKAKLV